MGTSGSLRPNSEAKKILCRSAPYAYNAAQRIVIVARKCAKPPGLFSNPARHLPSLTEACEALLVAIQHHSLKDDSGRLLTASDLMSLFSDAHPNWQKQYEYLNQHCPYFRDEEHIESAQTLPEGNFHKAKANQDTVGKTAYFRCIACGKLFGSLNVEQNPDHSRCSDCVLNAWRSKRKQI